MIVCLKAKRFKKELERLQKLKEEILRTMAKEHTPTNAKPTVRTLTRV